MPELKKGFSKRSERASDHIGALADIAAGSGRTDRYSTGIKGLDEYLFGGYGRRGKWEIVVLHATYGVGKSTLGLQMLAEPIKNGVKVGIMALEDDPDDVVYKLNLALGGTASSPSPHLDDVELIPSESLERLWTFDDIINEIERWYTKLNVDIILFDHIQFAMDAALLGDEKDQWRAQSAFMFKLNIMMKHLKDKTLIIISQQNKMKEIAGSIALPRVATKMIRLERVEHTIGRRRVQLEKVRGTPEREFPYLVEITPEGIEDSYEQIKVEVI